MLIEQLSANEEAARSSQAREGIKGVGNAGWGAQLKKGPLARVEDGLLHNHLLFSGINLPALIFPFVSFAHARPRARLARLAR